MSMRHLTTFFDLFEGAVLLSWEVIKNHFDWTGLVDCDDATKKHVGQEEKLDLLPCGHRHQSHSLMGSKTRYLACLFWKDHAWFSCSSWFIVVILILSSTSINREYLRTNETAAPSMGFLGSLKLLNLRQSSSFYRKRRSKGLDYRLAWKETEYDFP